MSLLVPSRLQHWSTDSSETLAIDSASKNPLDYAIDFVNSPAGAVAVTLTGMALSK